LDNDKEEWVMKYEFLSHTADIRMRLTGNDLADLFNAGVRGMAAVLKGDVCSNPGPSVIEHSIQIKSSDGTALLIDFLSEVLTRSYVENQIYCAVRFSSIDEKELRGTLYGYPIDQWDEEIKAVTYTEASVHRSKDNHWVSDVVFDI